MARLSHVLVIDSDPQGRQVMAFGFEREGVRATTAATPDEALANLQNDRPDVVVVTVRQGPDASRFILEGLSTGSMLPVVALGTEDHRRATIGQPNVDFITVPAYLRDVITATRMRAAARKDGKDPVVQGALSEYGLFFLLRTILASKQSAIVQIERANRKGELKICKGELRTAQIGSTTGAPALNQLLLWEEAALDIRFKAVTARSQFNSKGPALMEDVERFLRDFAHSARALGSAQTVYEVASSSNTDLAPEVAPVLRLFDGQRTISDVLDESPFRVFDTLRIISRFADTEVIRKKTGVEPRPAVSTSAASPLMESWLKGESERERIEAAIAAAASAAPTQAPISSPLPSPLSAQSGGTGPLPKLDPFAAPPSAAAVATGTVARSTRGEMMARTTGEDKAVKPRPSMVIDLPAEYLDEPLNQTGAAPTPAIPSIIIPPNTLPGTGNASRDVETQPHAAKSPGKPQAAAAPRTTGSMEIRTAPRPTRSSIPAGAGSIQLDPTLMAEIEPPKPARVPTPAPAARVPTPTPAILAAHLPPARKTGPHGTLVAKTRTGEFDALEKDFFDREKDLYNPDKPDSFEDL